ncbi:MAG: AsmA-like C-terminal region-containing protein, partial [Pseudomonadota bacterium]
NGSTDWFSTPTRPASQVEQAVVPPPPVKAPRLMMPGPGVSQPSLTISLSKEAVERVLAPDAPPKRLTAYFNADIDLAVRQARLGKLQTGRGAVSLDLKDGLFTGTLWRLALYGGEAQGKLNVDLNMRNPAFAGELRVEEIDTGALMQAVAGLNRLTGEGRLTLNLAGQGRDAKSIASSLMGNGAFAIADGSIEGISSEVLAAGLKSGGLDLRKTPGTRTAFSLLAGSFDINHGLATTHNLRLSSPSVSANARGIVNISHNMADLVVTPGPVATELGGGIAEVADGLSPLRIAGPLSNLRIGSSDDALIAGADSAHGRDTGGSIRRGPTSTGVQATAAGNVQALKPNALAPSDAGAPSLSVVPRDADGSPPLRMETLR